MTELILHHFDLSPFAEKIRKVLGIKELSWKSVQIPMIMPKPDLMPLTGGYRKTPVLQIGADVYCDTSLIVDVIEEVYPTPSLFGSGRLVNHAFQSLSDVDVFPYSAALSLHENAANLPEPLIADRRDYFSFLDFESFEADASHFRSQFSTHAKMLDEQLSDGRAFILGATPEWADVNAYLNIWTAHGNIPSSSEMFADLRHMNNWYERMLAFGEGDRTEIEATNALNIAQKATPESISPDNRSDESGITIGTYVCVTPTDHGCVPVSGLLANISEKCISITRSESDLGDIRVHFPRAGFRIEATDRR